MKKTIPLLILLFSIFFAVSCDSGSDPKTDVDEISVTDDEKSDEISDNEKNDLDDQTDKNDIEENDDFTNDLEQTDEELPECTENEMKCDETVLMWCQNGKWTKVKDCADEEKICGVEENVTKCIKEVIKCTENEEKCSGTKIQKCDSDGVWQDVEDCSDNSQTCSDGTDGPECTDIVTGCETGATKCSGNVVLKCNESKQWENDTVCSDEGKICEFDNDSASCIVPPCTPLAKECDGDSVKTCKNDATWESVLCEEGYTCVNDGTTVECKLKAVCTPGATDCSGNVVMLCNSSGQWSNFQNCANSSMICKIDAGNATCVVAPCTPGETKCEGKVVKTCNISETWDSLTCEGIQICDVVEGTAQCINPPECSEGETKCSGDVAMTCNTDLEWDTLENCVSTGKVCSTGSGSAQCVIPPCTPDDKKCEGTEIMTCNSSGIWETSQDCSDTSKICSDNGTDVQCIIAPVCTPGNTQCSEALIQNCNSGGQWTTITNCQTTGKTCAVVAEIPTCVCVDNDLRCTGVNLEICTSGTWTLQQNCGSTGKECSEEGENPACVVPPCTENDTMCSGDTVLICNNLGKWVNQQVCTDIEKVCKETAGDAECVEPPCTPNATKCGTRINDGHEDYIIYKCNSAGVWVQETDCLTADGNNPRACKMTAGSASCAAAVCGDGTWHDYIEWCDATDPVWQYINANPGELTCQDFWSPASGLGGTGNLSCLTSCRLDLINCVAIQTPYGTITTVAGDIGFTIDYAKRTDSNYMNNTVPDEAYQLPDPVFAGNVDGVNITPDAVTSGMVKAGYSYAFHVNGSSSSFIVLIQSSMEINTSTNAYNWFDQDIQFAFDDEIQVGSYSVDLHSGLGLEVYGTNGADYCLKALAFGGKVNFDSVSGLTNNDGGSFTLSGGPITLFHPNDVPIYGNISSQVEEIWGVPACPE